MASNFTNIWLRNLNMSIYSRRALRWLFIYFFSLLFMFKSRHATASASVLLFTEQPESWIQICTKNTIKGHLKSQGCIKNFHFSRSWALRYGPSNCQHSNSNFTPPQKWWIMCSTHHAKVTYSTSFYFLRIVKKWIFEGNSGFRSKMDYGEL